MYPQQTETKIPPLNMPTPEGGRGFVNYPYFKGEQRPVNNARTPINNAGLTPVDQIPPSQYGWTFSDLLDKDLMQKFLLSVISLNYSVGHLSVPPLVQLRTFDHRQGIMPLCPLFEVHSNVGEGEVVPLQTVQFDKVRVEMKKSVLKMGITDEMKMDSKDSFISPQDYMQSRMGEAFAYELDMQILDELQKTPMTHTVNLDTAAQPTKEIVEKIIPFIIGSFMATNHRVSGVAVNPMTWAYFQGVLNHDYHGLAMYREGVFPFMQNVDVCPCSLVPQNKMYFVDNQAPGVMVINHPWVIGRGYDDIDTGSNVQRVDVYRQCVSNILTRNFKPLKIGSQQPPTYTANVGVFELTLEGDIFEAFTNP